MAAQQIPADPSADPNADPSADPSASGDGSEQGYTICIVVDAQNNISVGVVPGTDADSDQDDDASQGGGASGGDDQSGSGGSSDSDQDFAPAKNIKDALSVALDIYRNDGQIGAMTNADDDMASGFGGAGQ